MKYGRRAFRPRFSHKKFRAPSFRAESLKAAYVVWVGRVPGIYLSWPEAKLQVIDFPGSRWKGFLSIQEAKDAFLGMGKRASHPSPLGHPGPKSYSVYLVPFVRVFSPMILKPSSRVPNGARLVRANVSLDAAKALASEIRSRLKMPGSPRPRPTAL